MPAARGVPSTVGCPPRGAPPAPRGAQGASRPRSVVSTPGDSGTLSVSLAWCLVSRFVFNFPFKATCFPFPRGGLVPPRERGSDSAGGAGGGRSRAAPERRLRAFSSGDVPAAATRQRGILINEMFAPTRQWQEANLAGPVNAIFRNNHRPRKLRVRLENGRGAGGTIRAGKATARGD